jgi:DNA-binding transcriptional ArsR family regulator
VTLRIHLADADLARITIAESPDPFWEVLLGLHQVQTRDGGDGFDRWRGQVRLTEQTRALLSIAPPRGYSPDFLTPAHGATGLDHGIEELLATPRNRLGREMAKLAATRPPPPSLRSLAGGDRDTLHAMADAIRSFYDTAIRPHWSYIRARVDADRVARADTFNAQGVTALLSGLHPRLRWRSSVLEVTGGHVSGDLRLGGRALRLIPAFFCTGAPTVLEDHRLPPVLVYPIRHDPGWLNGRAAPERHDEAPLVALLGATRARVLALAATGCTTTELSRQIGMSLSSVSYHTSILRRSGLLTTQRDGLSVRHDLTPLGAGVLNGRIDAP